MPFSVTRLSQAMTFQSILCPVDLSDLSRRALAYAVALGRSSGGKVKVLEVIEIAQPPLPGKAWSALALTAERRAEYLVDLERFVEPVQPDPAALDVRLLEGQVVQAILAEAETADLVVMGTHGRGGFERFVLGSVTEKVLRKAKCPVLAVPPGDQTVPEGEPFGTIVCALDFSSSSPAAIQYARDLGRPDGQLILVHVVAWPFGDSDLGPVPPAIDELRRSLEGTGREQLHDVVSGIRESGLRLKEVVICGKASREILRCAREHSADLIVMGAHGRDGVSLGWLGSTTHQVIHGAPCPILAVRAVGS